MLSLVCMVFFRSWFKKLSFRLLSGTNPRSEFLECELSLCMESWLLLEKSTV